MAHDYIKNISIRETGAPKLEGKIKIKLHNQATGKTETIEGHNLITNAAADILARNVGGVVNFNSMMPLYSKLFGGVLCFNQPLTETAEDYTIPAASDNAIIAHAGQTTYTDAADDTTRGNPNTNGLVLQSGSVTQTWEFAGTQGNGTISALALCHADIGDAGTGANTDAFASFSPFQTVGNGTQTTGTSEAAASFAVNNNYSYSFRIAADGTGKIYKSPVIYTESRLQGAALIPLTDYTEEVSFSVGHALNGVNNCYFCFDFTAGVLYLFSVYTSQSVYSLTPSDLTIDTINLNSGAASSETQTINLTGRYLWTLRIWVGGQGYASVAYPLQALKAGNYLYFPTCTGTSRPNPDGFIKVNITNFADVEEVTDNTALASLYAALFAAASTDGVRVLTDTGLVLEGANLYAGAGVTGAYNVGRYIPGLNNLEGYTGLNAGAVNKAILHKYFLATKYNLPQSVIKTSAQSMTITYTLTEV